MREAEKKLREECAREIAAERETLSSNDEPARRAELDKVRDEADEQRRARIEKYDEVAERGRKTATERVERVRLTPSENAPPPRNAPTT